MSDDQPDDGEPNEREPNGRGPGRAEPGPVEASFHVSPVTRWAHAITLAVLAVMAVAMLTGGTITWFVVLFVALVGIQSMNTVLLWRWQITTDEDGVHVRQGFGPPRHVRWDAIASVHGRLPPIIEIDGEDDLSLGTGISRRTLVRAAEHIGAHAAQRRTGPS